MITRMDWTTRNIALELQCGEDKQREDLESAGWEHIEDESAESADSESELL
jgi:hypothetical protein